MNPALSRRGGLGLHVVAGRSTYDCVHSSALGVPCEYVYRRVTFRKLVKV